MKKKIIVICIIAVLLVAVTSVYGLSLLGSEKDTTPPAETQEVKIKLDIDRSKNMPKDSSATNERTVTWNGTDSKSAETVTVKYHYSADFGRAGEADIYVDKNGDEYAFDKNGNLLGFMADSTTVTKIPSDKVSENKLTEDDVTEIAEEFAGKLFGDKFSGYKLTSIDFQDFSGKHFLSFAKKYGDGGFAYGEACNVIVDANGKVSTCSIPNRMEFEDFDEALLTGLTLEKLTDYAKAESDKILTDLTSFEVNGISIRKIDGKYSLEIFCYYTAEKSPSADVVEKYNISMAMSSESIEFTMSYYYPLEN